MRPNGCRRILWLAVVIIHLLAGFSLGHAARSMDGGASHLEHAVQMDRDGQPPCHDQQQPKATEDCSGHCLCCCALSVCGLIHVPLVLGAPPPETFAASAESALIDFHLPVELQPPNAPPSHA